MPPTVNVLDTVLNDFTSAITGWGPALSGYLLPLLLALIVLQFGLIAVEMTIARDTSMLVTHGMLGLFRVGVVWAIFQHAFDWGTDIVQTGAQLGTNISGFGLSPSQVFQSGVNIAYTIFHAHSTGGWLWSPFEHLEFLIFGSAILLCWLFASIVYLGTLIEGALLIYIAPLVIAFTPLNWTFDMLLVWGKALLGLAFKLCLILLTLSVGVVLANGWIADATATSTTFTTDMWNVMIIVVEAILFAFCVWMFPTRISRLSVGAAAIGFGEAVAGYAATAGQGGASWMMAGPSSGGGVGAHGGGGSSSAGGTASGGGVSPGNQQAATQLAQQVQTKLTA